MEKIAAILCILITAMGAVNAQENKREFSWENEGNTYTMKKYVFCLYISGQTRDHSEAEIKEIQAAHLAHLGDLADHHNLRIAGPFDDDTEKRGILIFDLETVEEAESLVAEDPAVKAGRLSFECHPWWGAKGSALD